MRPVKDLNVDNDRGMTRGMSITDLCVVQNSMYTSGILGCSPIALRLSSTWHRTR